MLLVVCFVFIFFFYSFFFFFQAEDGIRDHCVTGVQTCALPIFTGYDRDGWKVSFGSGGQSGAFYVATDRGRAILVGLDASPAGIGRYALTLIRSEERRVGKECRSRWWPDR